MESTETEFKKENDKADKDDISNNNSSNNSKITDDNKSSSMSINDHQW